MPVSYTVVGMPAAVLLQRDELNAPAHTLNGFAVAPLGLIFDLAPPGAARPRLNPAPELGRSARHTVPPSEPPRLGFRAVRECWTAYPRR